MCVKGYFLFQLAHEFKKKIDQNVFVKREIRYLIKNGPKIK